MSSDILIVTVCCLDDIAVGDFFCACKVLSNFGWGLCIDCVKAVYAHTAC